MVTFKKQKMTAQEKIKFLESRVETLENENAILKSMLKKQTLFGNKMTGIVSEMDELLGKKKLEIESLTNQLLAKSNIESLDDFSIDLESQVMIKSNNFGANSVSFLEHQKQVKMNKERLENEFEKTKDGKFKCPYTDICSHVTKYRHNLAKHIRIHTGEKPFACDICGQGFTDESNCKKHMLTHPDMKGVQCKYCRVRFSELEIESHQVKCQVRQKRKRKRIKSDSE